MITLAISICLAASLTWGVRQGLRGTASRRPLVLLVFALICAIAGLLIAPDFLTLIRSTSMHEEAMSVLAALLILNGLLMVPKYLGQLIGGAVRKCNQSTSTGKTKF